MNKVIIELWSKGQRKIARQIPFNPEKPTEAQDVIQLLTYSIIFDEQPRYLYFGMRLEFDKFTVVNLSDKESEV